MKPFFGKELLRLYNNVNQEENYKKDNKDIMYYLYISFILSHLSLTGRFPWLLAF